MGGHSVLQAAPLRPEKDPVAGPVKGRRRLPVSILGLSLVAVVGGMISLRVVEIAQSDLGQTIEGWVVDRAGGLGLQFAADPAPPSRPVTAVSMLSAGPVPPPAVAQGRVPPIGGDMVRPADGRLVAEVTRRSLELDRRAQDLDAREARLTAGEALVKQQLAELGRLRRDVEQLVVRESEAAEREVQQVVLMFANMRPPQAAKVLEKMVPDKAGLVLFRLGERQAGPILAQMEQAAALAVTQEMMGRREAFRR